MENYMKMRDGYVDVVVDLQYGSTGKGLLCGYLSRQNMYDTVIAVNMPNAGHTFIDEEDVKFIFKVLPTSACSQQVERIMIGPGAVFHRPQLEKEIKALRAGGYTRSRIFIHENAWMLTEDHRQHERNQGRGSTQSGAGAALVSKIDRGCKWDMTNAGTYMRGDNAPRGVYIMNQLEWLQTLTIGDRILLEGSQGYSLGINAGFYPYTTSRDCTPARFLADAGVPVQAMGKVYGSMRVHPIRVGGDSGGWYPDQREMTWEELGVPEERTTVTNKIRRVASFSFMQAEEAIMACRPNEIFLNFVQYDRTEAKRILNWITAKYPEGQTKMSFLGYGPTVNDVGTFA